MKEGTIKVQFKKSANQILQNQNQVENELVR